MSISPYAIEAQVLADMLATQKSGDFIAYTTLSKHIGRDVQGKARHYLSSARKQVLRSKGLVFRPDEVDKIRGLRCLTDSQKANLSVPVIESIRRKARKTMREMASVKHFDSMSQHDQIAHNVGVSLLGAINQAGKRSNRKKLEDAVEAASKKMPFIKTLEIFRS